MRGSTKMYLKTMNNLTIECMLTIKCRVTIECRLNIRDAPIHWLTIVIGLY